MLETPENGGYEGQKSTKMPILCSGASPMVGLIHLLIITGDLQAFMTCSGLPYGFCTPCCGCRTAAAEPLLPNCCCHRAAAAARLPAKRGRRYLPPLPTTAPTAAPRTAAAEPLPHPAPLPPHRGYSFRPLMASRSLVSISSASSGLSSRTFFTPSRPWASLLSL